MPKLTRQQKITFAEMRWSGVRGLLIYCANYRCSHSIAISADQWRNHVRLSIWNRGSSAGPAAREGLTCGPISRPRRWGYPANALLGPLRRTDRIAGRPKAAHHARRGNLRDQSPKERSRVAEWQAAIEALMLVAELAGPTMFARIGVMRALNRGYVREFDTSRKDTHWGKRKLKRDE